MMRFAETRLHQHLTASICEAVAPYKINVLRADYREYHPDVYLNILTYIYRCWFGIAVFERIETQEPNPNISLEVGLMFGLRKRVCLLKDKTLPALQSDLVGQLYKPFDVIEPESTVKQHLCKWLIDAQLVDKS
jgi:hypothetical protein